MEAYRRGVETQAIAPDGPDSWVSYKSGVPVTGVPDPYGTGVAMSVFRHPIVLVYHPFLS